MLYFGPSLLVLRFPTLPTPFPSLWEPLQVCQLQFVSQSVRCPTASLVFQQGPCTFLSILTDLKKILYFCSSLLVLRFPTLPTPFPSLWEPWQARLLQFVSQSIRRPTASLVLQQGPCTFLSFRFVGGPLGQQNELALVFWSGLGDPFVSQNPREFYTSHSDLCMWHLELWSNFNFLHNSLRIAFPLISSPPVQIPNLWWLYQARQFQLVLPPLSCSVAFFSSLARYRYLSPLSISFSCHRYSNSRILTTSGNLVNRRCINKSVAFQ